MKLPRDLREFIALLNSHDVRYPIVGGYAVAYHGYPRATGDIDLFVEVSQENARKLIAVVGEFGFASLGLTEKDFLEDGNGGAASIDRAEKVPASLFRSPGVRGGQETPTKSMLP